MTDKIDIEKMVREAEKEMFGHVVDTSKTAYSIEDIAMFELVAKKYHEEKCKQGEPWHIAFPVMLRKMWSGSEVQAWLNDLPPLYAVPNEQSEYISSLKREHKEDLTFIMRQKSHLNELVAKAKAVIARWDSPDWKDGTHTADYIHDLRNAVEGAERHNITTE
jgi:hypothetical protein